MGDTDRDPHGGSMKARRHRQIMAEFGFKALQHAPLDELLADACAQVVDGCGVEFAKVLKYRPTTDDLLIVAGIGWTADVVGRVALPATMDSPPGRAFRTGEAVYVEDLSRTPEFRHSDVLRQHGVVALVNVPIRTSKFTYGVLEADSNQPRRFTEDDQNFLIGFANLIAAAVERRRLDAERDRLIRELTEARQVAEEALTSNKRLLATAGHDLAQPVLSILLTLDRLDRLDRLDKQLSEEERWRLVDRARNAALRLRHDLDQLLTVAQIERGAFDPRIETVDLEPLLSGLVEEFRAGADAKGLSLRYVPTRLRVRTDARLLEHIIRNLVSNAVKYTNRGRILVGCRRHSGSVDIKVHDTGIGIAQGDLDKMFKEFHRLDPARGEGRGLGLAIVKQMADLLGHPVTVRSRRGTGTCFRMTVPRA
jgi:signal transduction histidine kinase